MAAADDDPDQPGTLDAAAWRTVRDLAANRPLAHPLPFSMGAMSFPLPPPPHLIEIYGRVYDALTTKQSLNPQQAQVGAEGVVRTLMRLMPREHGKSEGVAHVIPSWAALRYPNIRILIMSETGPQAKAKLSECATTIRNLAPRFGRQVITDNTDALTLDRPGVFAEPTIKAAGMDTGVTGGHFDLILFDDIISWDGPVHQRTEDSRDKVRQKFDDYLNLGAGDDAIFLVIGTRKHPDDLYGTLLERGTWDCRVERAIADWSIVENRDYDVLTDAGNRYPGDVTPPAGETITGVEAHRAVDVLWPEMYDLDGLLFKYLQAAGDGEGFVWQRENQNDAEVMLGRILSERMLTFEDAFPAGRSMADLVWYAGVDIGIETDAQKAASNDSDYWAVAVLGYDRPTATYFLDRVRRTRGQTPKEAADWLATQLDPYPVRRVNVESNQAQRWFVQACQDVGLSAKESPSSGDKEARIISMSSRFENGTVRIRGDRDTPHWGAFVKEWVGFPAGEHDDMLDATEIALRGRSEEDEERTKTSAAPFI